jgi:hypothetical protein
MQIPERFSMNSYLPALLALAAGSLTVTAADSAALTETRATLEQWVQTRQLISKTKTDWQADKETLEQTAVLFERELGSIAAQMSKVSTNSTQVDKERELALAQQKELNDASEAVKTLVAGLEKKITELAPSFPPPLAEKLQPLIKRIPSDPVTTKASGLERLQNVVGIVNEVDKFNAAVTVVSEVQKNPSGAEVQVETMYVGLAQAYFVDKAGDYAGVCLPSGQGWQWTPKNELAGKIQKSIAMYKNAAPADFVSLPVQIK